MLSGGRSWWLPWVSGFIATCFLVVWLLGMPYGSKLQCVKSCTAQRAVQLQFSNGSSPDDADLLLRCNSLAAAYRPLLAEPTPFPVSFWFVKNVKVGGTTLAGVLRTICAHYSTACLNPLPGRIGWKKVQEIRNAAKAAGAVGYEHVAISNHGAYLPQAKRHLGKPPVLLFTTVRHPLARVLSAYFYNLIGKHRSHEGVPAEEGARCVAALRAGKPCALMKGFKEHYVHEDGIFGRNHIFKYIAGGKETAQAAFGQYDFVFITERFDESLVVFMLKYGLEMRDIAYLKMKDRSGTYPRSEDMPQWARDFILTRNQLDLELWELGMAALDGEIERLRAAGHDVEGAMERYRLMQAVVERECADYERWYEEHEFDTMLTYWGKDNGAGPRCLAHATRLAGYA